VTILGVAVLIDVRETSIQRGKKDEHAESKNPEKLSAFSKKKKGLRDPSSQKKNWANAMKGGESTKGTRPLVSEVKEENGTSEPQCAPSGWQT